MPQKHAWQCFDLDIEDGRPLNPGKITNLGLGKRDVVDYLLRQRGDDGLDLFGCESKVRRRPVIEPRREFPNGRIAPPGYVCQHLLNGGANLRVGLARLGVGDAFF